MSIIHDALKKAQAQRKEKPAGIPHGNTPEAKKKPHYLAAGIIVIVAAIVLTYLFVPAFHPKKTIPVKQMASVEPAQAVSPMGTPAQAVTQKSPEAGPQVDTAVSAQIPSPDRVALKKASPVSVPAPELRDTAGRPEPVRRGSKGAQPAADDEPIRRIPVRKTEDDSLNRQYNEALKLMGAGQLREAQKVFLDILGRKPDHVETLNNMGVISASSGNRKEAVAYFNKVLEYRPNYPKAYNNIGLVMMSEGNPLLAEEYFRKAIAMDPEGLEPYLNLAALLRAGKKFAEAAKLLEGPIHRNIKDPNLYLSYAVVKDNMGHSEQAIKFYRQYLGLAKPSQVRNGVAERLRYLEERGKR